MFILNVADGLCLFYLYALLMLVLASGDEAVSIDWAKLSKVFT
jgi:hypothetical protein